MRKILCDFLFTSFVDVCNGNFRENAKDGLVVIDFWAEWCSPCKIVSRALERLMEEFHYKLLRVNVEECPEIAAKLKIMTLPTTVMMKDGREIARFVGGATERGLRKWMKKKLEN